MLLLFCDIFKWIFSCFYLLTFYIKNKNKTLKISKEHILHVAMCFTYSAGSNHSYLSRKLHFYFLLVCLIVCWKHMQEIGDCFRKHHYLVWNPKSEAQWPRQNVLTKSAAVNCFSPQCSLLLCLILISKRNLLSILGVSYHVSYFFS